jgi:hypothetical protein
VLSTLFDRDLPVVLALAGAALLTGWARIRQRPAAEPETAWLVFSWLTATALVLLLEHPLWRNHVAHLVPATALLVALALERAGPMLGRRAGLALVAALAVVVPYHALHMGELLWPRGPRGAEAAARTALEELPPRGWAISDEPGLVWRTGRRTPADLVDTSVLRIDSGRITAASLAAHAADPRVCAVLVWSSRFGRLSELPGLLTGYRESGRYGGPRVMYTRTGCAPGAALGNSD